MYKLWTKESRTQWCHQQYIPLSYEHAELSHTYKLVITIQVRTICKGLLPWSWCSQNLHVHANSNAYTLPHIQNPAYPPHPLWSSVREWARAI